MAISQSTQLTSKVFDIRQVLKYKNQQHGLITDLMLHIKPESGVADFENIL